MKSYTDLEQSKKLAEILPLESADYYHAPDANIVITEPYITYFGKERCIPAYKGAVPCWSLAALLDYLSANFRVDIKYLDNYWELDCQILAVYTENLVDARYEMILKLNELNLL